MKRLDISPSQGLILHYLLSQKGRTVFSTELHRQVRHVQICAVHRAEGP